LAARAPGWLSATSIWTWLGPSQTAFPGPPGRWRFGRTWGTAPRWMTRSTGAAVELGGLDAVVNVAGEIFHTCFRGDRREIWSALLARPAI
jgi:hypothetical protein